jgi:hypothetical protein
MKSVLLTGILGLAMVGTAIEARADCQQVRGTDVETVIPSNDVLGRVLGIVDGVLDGASTAYLTSASDDFLNATSNDVFVTRAGDILRATGVVILTPVPGSMTDVVEAATLTVTGGSGKYDGANGTIKVGGRGSFTDTGGTFDVNYRGSVCGPHIEPRRR